MAQWNSKIDGFHLRQATFSDDRANALTWQFWPLDLETVLQMRACESLND